MSPKIYKSALTPYMRAQVIKLYYAGGENTVSNIAKTLHVNEHAVRVVIRDEVAKMKKKFLERFNDENK